jgi:uncharacterized protein YecE (DUF72 family)
MIQVRVGIAGWSYPDWEGIVYPSPKPSGFDPLSYLVRYFETIEINSTFYRPPTAKTTASWARRCRDNPNFRFTVKLFKGFTHDRSATSRDREIVKKGLAPLVDQDRLGALLIQFPWSFKNDGDSRRYLDRLLADFHQYHPVIEVRHSSWNQTEFFEYLAGCGAGFCNIDQPRIGRSLGPTDQATGKVGYVRLHGRNYREWFREDAGRDARYDYLYSEEELDPWLDKIERVAEDSSETYVITNNHFRGKAAVNALQIKAKLVRKRVLAPRSLVDEYPVLESATHPEGTPRQGKLF